MKRINIFLVLIFVLGLCFRFAFFRESTYFGYDQARDAYNSIEIYTKGKLKTLGPPTTGNVGIFHGPLSYYIIGPSYLLFGGDPLMASGVFRVINALGVFIVFAIALNLFNPKVALLSALVYAVSYEESQYSMYVGNPPPAIIAILFIFLGAAWLWKNNSKKKYSLVLMMGGAAAASQLNIMYFYSFFMVLALLVVLRKELFKLPKSSWVMGILTAGLFLSTFVIAEIKYNFRSTRIALAMIQKGYGIMSPDQSKYLLYWDKYLVMFKDNVFGFTSNLSIIIWLALIVTIWVAYKALKNKNFAILLVWMLGWIFLMMMGGHTGYYTNVGLGVGIIVATVCFLSSIESKLRFALPIGIMAIVTANAFMIYKQAPKSLIREMITQDAMRLDDELKIIDTMYGYANGRGFTIKQTGIPYNIQTVWSYLFNSYGLKKYGYLPYWENGNTLGYPGKLPTPINGTTCVRFYLREPMHGLPGSLVDMDIKSENNFSTVLQRQEIGKFLLETRKALDLSCHDIKALTVEQ